MGFTPEQTARFNRYKNYRNIRRDLAEESERAHARDALKLFFRNIDSAEPKLQDELIKSVLHGLAEEDLPRRDRIFFQALLYSRPEKTGNHLIGALKVHHHSPIGGAQRVQAITYLLCMKPFSTPQIANNLVAAFHGSEGREAVKKILQHKNHANHHTFRSLMGAAIAEPAELAEHAMQIIDHANYVQNQALINKIVNECTYNLSSQNPQRALVANALLERLKTHRSVRNALNALIRQPSGRTPIVRVVIVQDGVEKEIIRRISPDAITKIYQLLYGNSGRPGNSRKRPGPDIGWR